MKTAVVVGVQEIVRVNIECSHCFETVEWPINEFVEKFGEPFTDEHLGRIAQCPKCHEFTRLGDFYVED